MGALGAGVPVLGGPGGTSLDCTGWSVVGSWLLAGISVLVEDGTGHVQPTSQAAPSNR